ncbi:hypothetical protein ACOI1C_02000 [Bacillus sp. DJP31]|uniref:hypothetical protein n=1 Tax=Bacillus sp. DJP31 TaxID=3409789 RepID=UPI003BB63EF8
MGKRMCWMIILLTMALNVVLLHYTIESYYGKEYDHVYLFTGISMISVIIAFSTFVRWRKLEYK